MNLLHFCLDRLTYSRKKIFKL